MYELTYECDTYSAGLSATDTALESLEIMITRIKNRSIGGTLKSITIKQVDKPTLSWDGWGRTVDEDIIAKNSGVGAT